ncbi:MAG: ATP synthase subunit I [Bryobacteraceae bacterium]
MDPDQALFDAALRRIGRGTLVIAALGCLVLTVFRGWRWGVPFLFGAAASYLNFRWLKKVVDALGGTAGRRPKARFAVIMGLRYLLLAGAAYAIVNFTTLSLPAALIGLFAPVAAVILEIVFELIYAP